MLGRVVHVGGVVRVGEGAACECDSAVCECDSAVCECNSAGVSVTVLV